MFKKMTYLLFISSLWACKGKEHINEEDLCAYSGICNQDQVDIDLNFFKKSLPNTQIYSKNVLLRAPLRVMQSFDIDANENIYYSQLGAVNQNIQGQSRSHEIYILKSKANVNTTSDFMTLKYFGHGSNIAIEEENSEIYVWVNSNGTKNTSTLEYDASRSVSRIKYESGKVYEDGHAGETYFLNNGLYNTHPALDVENDVLAISATESGTRYFFFYRLSEAKKLALEDFTFDVIVGGEETGVDQQTITRNVRGYDLSRLKPLSTFFIEKGSNKMTDINSYSFQGFDVHGKYVFFYEGDGNENNIINGPSGAYVTVFSLTGKILCHRTPVEAIANLDDLHDEGITKTGYMEAEGIKIINNKVYIAFASRGYVATSDDNRRANIFRYDLVTRQ